MSKLSLGGLRRSLGVDLMLVVLRRLLSNEQWPVELHELCVRDISRDDGRFASLELPELRGWIVRCVCRIFGVREL